MTAAKRILLVAATTGYQTQMFVEAAERLDLPITLATDRCHVLDNPWGDNALPIRFDDPESAAQAISKLPKFDGIVALGDRPARVAAVIAEQLGIRYNSVDSVSACSDKYLARLRFQAAGLLVPTFYRARLDKGAERAAEQSTYPCVLKPLGLSASRGVIRANSRQQFVAAFHRIQAILSAPERVRARFIQVESFIPGRELALEGLVVDGKLHVLALFDKPDPLDGPFFEETIYVTPSREESAVQQSITRTAQIAVQALGLTEGPIHAEMRVNQEGVWMLEVAARPIGGLCGRVLPGLAERILKHAVGERVAVESLLDNAHGVMMIPIPRGGVYRSVSGIEAAGEVASIEEVIITAKPGHKLVPLPEGNSYLGFMFARAETPAEVVSALRSAHALLDFEITASLTVI